MPALSATPLLFAILTGTPGPAQPASEVWEAVGAHHVGVRADTAGQEQEVVISPLLSTTFFFNSPLLRGGVVVQQRELFQLVTVDETNSVVTLLPSSRLPLGSKLLLTVRFADGAVPESTSFRLVAHPTRAEPQVNVYRQPRSGESYQLEARQERERAERCGAELARTQAEQQHPGGLVGLLVERLMTNGEGIKGQDISTTSIQRPDEALRARSVFSYRAQGRVAMDLSVNNLSTQSWRVDGDGVRLVSREGVRLRVLQVWPLESIPLSGQGRVRVEAEATEEQARGTYVLKLGEANGSRTITLRGVTFP